MTDLSRVLIADRDPHVRQQLYGALLDANVFADCVGSTVEALAKLDEETYGVVVLDVELPPGTIETVVRRIASMPPRERPVVLALAAAPESARSLDIDIVQIVLRRPILLRQLVDLIGSCLRSVVSREGPASGKGALDDHVTS
jgi:DNA-binding response OmpR family regulator